MEKLKRYDLNCNIFDVYNYDGLSMQELLCQFYTKINECVDFSNSTLDLCEWLVSEGLAYEVATKLSTWLNDGTLEDIINVSLFESLNKKVDNVSSHVEHIEKTQVSLLRFGGNTENEDNKEAWEKAMNYLSNNGGGTLLIPPGAFNFSPGLHINSNCIVKGSGFSTVLKVKNGSGDFYSFISLGKAEKNGIEDCTIDLNRNNNEGLIERLDGKFSPQIAVYFVDSHYSRVERCYIKGCGVWCISAETSDIFPYNTNISIKDNIIEWYPQSSEKAFIGDNMPYDNTMIYLDAENYIIENNKITCLKELQGMTGVELHQRLGKALNNTITGFRNGFLVVPMISAYNNKSCDMLVTNNNIEALAMGISLWGVSTKKLDYVTISNNDIKMNSNHTLSSYGICVNPTLSTSRNKEIENINIYNNTISFASDLNVRNHSDYLLNYCGIHLKNVNSMKNVVVKGNTLLNAPGNGLYIDSDVKCDNFVITDNSIINCCSNTNISNEGYTKKAPIYIGQKVTNSYIGTNTLINNLYDVDCIIRNFSDIKIAKQNIQIKNKVSDFEITDFTTRFGFDSGSATFNVVKSNYYLDGDLCSVYIEVDITEPSTSGYGMYCYLPFKAKQKDVTIDVAFKNINANKISLFTTENSNLCYIKKSSVENMNAIRPPEITSGAKLIISGSYLINGRYN